MQALEIFRRGTSRDYPTVVTMANAAEWTAAGGWRLRDGDVHVLASDSEVVSVHYTSMRDYHMKERPTDFLKSTNQPDEMQRAELTRYLRAMQRSGTDVNPLRVDLMLRIAIPATCLIIFLFGAPLATSNQRGGAAIGVGIAIATTMVFLMLVQLTKAVGGKGLVSPELAAWIPSIVFGVTGVYLLARVRT
jgi:lipopolysaccharide export system permease protein